MAKPRTLYDKIWDDHLVDEQPDGTCLLYIDRHLVHEVTSPQAFEGLRTALPKDVPAGATVALELEIATPKRPGEYILELDALREQLAWFSSQRPGSSRRLPVTVLPSDDR